MKIKIQNQKISRKSKVESREPENNARKFFCFRPSTFDPRQAFTLVEMLLVVAIIGILAALVIPKIAGTSEHSRVVAAQTDIRAGIKTALDHYEIDNGYYPRSLNDLLVQPSNAKNWRGPYFDPPQLPVDPWGNPYVYYFPSKRNQPTYDLLSVGPDGKEGTDDDIGNWTPQQ